MVFDDAHRMEALARILGLVYLVFVLIALPFLVLGAALFMVADVSWQLIVGTNGPNTWSPGSLIWRLWDHVAGNVNWVLFGTGEFQWLP